MPLVVVTLVEVRPNGTETTYTNVRALSRLIRDNPISGAARLQPDVMRWHLDASTIPSGVVPDRGWRIESPEYGNWMILSADLQTLDTRWQCETQLIE